MKTALCNSKRQSYRHEKALVAIFQLVKGQNLFRAVSQKNKDDFLIALRASKYLYRAGLMSVASPASGKFGVVSVNSTLEHRAKECFIKNSFLFAGVDCRHCRSCI